MLLYLKQTSCSYLCVHVGHIVFYLSRYKCCLDTVEQHRICPPHKLMFPKNLILSNSHIQWDKEFGGKKVMTYFLPDDNWMISKFGQWKIVFLPRNICWHLAVEEISIKKKKKYPKPIIRLKKIAVQPSAITGEQMTNKMFYCCFRKFPNPEWLSGSQL